MGISGHPTMTYSIENVKRDDICQNEDKVAISDGSELKNVFFSDSGVR
jgi:chromosome transmission fidelity protein 4